jgi:hypothetical protein
MLQLLVLDFYGISLRDSFNIVQFCSIPLQLDLRGIDPLLVEFPQSYKMHKPHSGLV